MSKRIYQLSREVIDVPPGRRAAADLFDALRGSSRTRRDTDLELRRRMRDVEDHATRVMERGRIPGPADQPGQRTTLVGQRQNDEMARITEAGFEQNEQVKRISSWAAISFAPSFVAGIYGMNFDHMPELHWSLGYPFALLLMALLRGAL